MQRLEATKEQPQRGQRQPPGRARLVEPAGDEQGDAGDRGGQTHGGAETACPGNELALAAYDDRERPVAQYDHDDGAESQKVGVAVAVQGGELVDLSGGEPLGLVTALASASVGVGRTAGAGPWSSSGMPPIVA